MSFGRNLLRYCEEVNSCQVDVLGYRYLNYIRDQIEQGTVDMVSDLQSD